MSHIQTHFKGTTIRETDDGTDALLHTGIRVLWHQIRSTLISAANEPSAVLLIQGAASCLRQGNTFR